MIIISVMDKLKLNLKSKLWEKTKTKHSSLKFTITPPITVPLSTVMSDYIEENREVATGHGAIFISDSKLATTFALLKEIKQPLSFCFLECEAAIVGNSLLTKILKHLLNVGSTTNDAILSVAFPIKTNKFAVDHYEQLCPVRNNICYISGLIYEIAKTYGRTIKIKKTVTYCKKSKFMLFMDIIIDEVSSAHKPPVDASVTIVEAMRALKIDNEIITKTHI